MSYQLAMIVLLAGGGSLVIAGLAFFRHPRWLLGWIKGMLVLCLILVGGYAILIAISLTRYQSLSDMQTVATIGVTRTGNQAWQVRLEAPNHSPITADVSGDQWQLDARIVRFSGPLRWMGVAPGYRLEGLSGRYVALEQERSAARTVTALSDEYGWSDIWQLDRRFNLPFVESVYGNATFMPMADGANFDVRLSSSGLVAIPINAVAHKAVSDWTN